MFREAAESSQAVAAQLDKNRDIVADAVARVVHLAPRAIVSCARGSSDHAATYAKYVIETRLGILTSSASPSVSSVYRSKQNLAGTLYLAISQSGASPDLIANVSEAKAAGATVVALVNATESPLAELADVLIPLRAGEERSVAATKTYIATLSAIAHLVSEWLDDDGLRQALSRLPQDLNTAWSLDWTPLLPTLIPAGNLFVIGRGLGYGVAQEAALKLKETCGLHAEAFSAAEVRHGPMAIVGPGFPVLVLAQEDETRAGMDELADDFMRRDAAVHMASEGAPATWRLPVVHNAHPVVAPALMIQAFYRMAATLSIARGLNPDQPPHLRKITQTV